MASAGAFARLITQLKELAGRRPKKSAADGLDLTIRAMALLCFADGRIDSAEISDLQKVYAQATGEEVSQDVVRRAVEAVRSETQSIWDVLEDLRPTLSEAQKQELMRVCGELVRSDGHIDPAERKMIMAIGRALGMDDAAIGHFLLESPSPAAP